VISPSYSGFNTLLWFLNWRPFLFSRECFSTNPSFGPFYWIYLAVREFLVSASLSACFQLEVLCIGRRHPPELWSDVTRCPVGTERQDRKRRNALALDINVLKSLWGSDHYIGRCDLSPDILPCRGATLLPSSRSAVKTAPIAQARPDAYVFMPSHKVNSGGRASRAVFFTTSYLGSLSSSHGPRRHRFGLQCKVDAFGHCPRCLGVHQWVQCYSHDTSVAAAVWEVLVRNMCSLAGTALAVHTLHLGLKWLGPYKKNLVDISYHLVRTNLDLLWAKIQKNLLTSEQKR